MRMAHKSWLSAGLLSLFLAGCTNTTTTETPAPQQPAYNGPVEEISGAEPRYEPLIRQPVRITALTVPI